MDAQDSETARNELHLVTKTSTSNYQYLPPAPHSLRETHVPNLLRFSLLLLLHQFPGDITAVVGYKPPQSQMPVGVQEKGVSGALACQICTLLGGGVPCIRIYEPHKICVQQDAFSR